MPQFTATIDDVDIHFAHIRAAEANAPALLMTHGWPDSIVELFKVIDALTKPDSGLTFHSILPSLPGYGFSAAGWDVERIAQAWAGLMAALGYLRYFAQGGDWGAAVGDRNCVASPGALPWYSHQYADCGAA